MTDGGNFMKITHDLKKKDGFSFSISVYRCQKRRGPEAHSIAQFFGPAQTRYGLVDSVPRLVRPAS